MPRARRLSTADIAARKAAARRFSDETVAVAMGSALPGTADVPGGSDAEAAGVEALLDRIAEIAHAEQRPEFRERAKVCLWRYEAETLQNQQEHPKRQIAAYKPIAADARRLLQGLRGPSKRLRRRRRARARRLLERLRALPDGLRLPLGAGNTETRLVELIGATGTRFVAAIPTVEPQLEELLGRVERELAALSRRPLPNRLANPASDQLREGLLELFAPFTPDDAELDRRVAEVLRRVAEVLQLLRIRFPNEKKNRGRFRGRFRRRQT
jgi:hypothetical protein